MTTSIGFTPGHLHGQDYPPAADRPPLVLEFGGRQLISQVPPVGDLDGEFEVSDYPWSRIIPVADDTFWIGFVSRYDMAGMTGRDTLYLSRCVYHAGSDNFTIGTPVPVIGGGRGTAALPPLTGIDYWFGGFDALTIVPLADDKLLFRVYDGGGTFDNATYGSGSYHESVGTILITMDWDAEAVAAYGTWQVAYRDPVSHDASESTGGGWDGRFLRLDDGRVVNVTSDWDNGYVTLRCGDLNTTTGTITWGAEYQPGTGDFWAAYYDDMYLFQIGPSKIALWWKAEHASGADPGAGIAMFTIDGSHNFTMLDYAEVNLPLRGNTLYNNDVLDYPPYFSLTMPSDGFWFLITDWKHATGSYPANQWMNDVLTFDVTQLDGSHAATFQQPFDDFAYVNPEYEGYHGDPFNYPGWDFIELASLHLDESVMLFFNDITDLDAANPVSQTIPDYWVKFEKVDDIYQIAEHGTAGGIIGVDDQPSDPTRSWETYPVSHLGTVQLSGGGEIIVCAAMNTLLDSMTSVRTATYNLLWWKYGVTNTAATSHFPGESTYPSESQYPGE